MLHDDGQIKQDFFKPTQVQSPCIVALCLNCISTSLPSTQDLQVVVLDSKKWGPEETELLIKVQPDHTHTLKCTLDGVAAFSDDTLSLSNSFCCLMMRDAVVMQGLEEFGIGKWRDIVEKHLTLWDDQALRLKACRLMGTQSLARYVGWKGDR